MAVRLVDEASIFHRIERLDRDFFRLILSKEAGIRAFERVMNRLRPMLERGRFEEGWVRGSLSNVAQDVKPLMEKLGEGARKPGEWSVLKELWIKFFEQHPPTHRLVRKTLSELHEDAELRIRARMLVEAVPKLEKALILKNRGIAKGTKEGLKKLLWAIEDYTPGSGVSFREFARSMIRQS